MLRDCGLLVRNLADGRTGRFESIPSTPAAMTRARRRAARARLGPPAGRRFGAFLAALGLAAPTLQSRRLRRATAWLKPPVKLLRDLHSGVIPDYVTWMIFGTAVFGAAALVAWRTV